MKKLIIPIFILASVSITTAYAQYSSSQSQSGYSSSNQTGTPGYVAAGNSGYSSSASQGYTSSTSNTSQYSSSGSVNSSTYASKAVPNHHQHKRHADHFGFSIQLPGQQTFVFDNHGIKPMQPNIVWVGASLGRPLPHHAVVGGFESQGTQYVCRVNYHGLQPGKLYQGQCVIGYAGRQIPFNHYEILVSKRNLSWIPARFGFIPNGALQGGEENGRPLYICQAKYHGGTHAGKLVGQNCNFAWGESEISVPYYKVLVG